VFGKALGYLPQDNCNDATRVLRLPPYPENIIFTSGGTEGNNLAIQGTVRAHASVGKHIVALGIEHPSVLEPLKEYELQGFEVTYVPVNKEGIVSASDVMAAITPQTVLVTVMYANNEIGSVQPIAEIGRAIRKYHQKNNTTYPYFHTDACQAPNYLDLNVEKLHVDLMTLNGSKIYGPKGSGCLYVHRRVVLETLLWGGGQERGLRSGTENVSAIAGFAEALRLVQEKKSAETKRLQEISEYFFQELKKILPAIVLNGPQFGSERLPNNVHVTVPGMEAEQVLLYLDREGISCSAASACASSSGEVSHVLRSIGLSETQASHSIRFSLGQSTDMQDVEAVSKAVKKVFGTIHKK
jgi:cysteine desulfurase